MRATPNRSTSRASSSSSKCRGSGVLFTNATTSTDCGHIHLRRQQRRRLALRGQPDRSARRLRPATNDLLGVRHRGDLRHVHNAKPRQQLRSGAHLLHRGRQCSLGNGPGSRSYRSTSTRHRSGTSNLGQPTAARSHSPRPTARSRSVQENVVPEPSTFTLTIVGGGGGMLLSLVLRWRDKRGHHTKCVIFGPEPQSCENTYGNELLPRSTREPVRLGVAAHKLPRPESQTVVSLRALHRVPSRADVRAHFTGHGSPGSDGAALLLETVLTSSSPALSVIQGHQLALRRSFSRGFSVLLGRRRTVFIESAGEPDFPLGPSLFSRERAAILRKDKGHALRC